MRALRALLLLAPLSAVIGCGSLGDDERRAPLATLEGRLTAASMQASAPNAVRVAVVWATVDTSSKYKTAQDISATPVFPSQFRIELTDPPPAEAMSSGTTSAEEPVAPTGPGPASRSLRPKTTGSAGFSAAVGTVVAYEDLNGNGKLDIVGDDATAFVDRVLGVNGELSLVYVEGDAASEGLTENGTHPVRGYNLLRRVVSECQHRLPSEGGESAPPPCPPDTSGWLPITTLYDLPLTVEPRFANVMCEGDLLGPPPAGTSDVPSSKPANALPPGPGPSGTWPKKDDPNVHCMGSPGSGVGYYYDTCSTRSEGLCKGAITECHATSWGYATSAPPAEWPCH